MYSTKVSYEDFNGEKKEETLYFYMNKPEMLKLLKERPEFMDTLSSIADRLGKKNTDGDPTLYIDFMSVIDELFRMSYGIKTVDGKFKKKPDILEDFLSSNAYDALFTKFMDNPDEFNVFTRGIFPADVMTDEVIAEATRKAEAMKEE